MIQNRSIDPNNSFRSSFDISSLNTNVSLDETIAICDDPLYRSHLDPTLFPKVFLKLMHIATKYIQSNFHNTTYQQFYRIAMGCPFRAAMAIFVGKTISNDYEDH